MRLIPRIIIQLSYYIFLTAISLHLIQQGYRKKAQKDGFYFCQGLFRGIKKIKQENYVKVNNIEDVNGDGSGHAILIVLLIIVMIIT